ncbi:MULTISPECIES: hypothetical protein [unclassified Streptomyces]|jgi:hypothetical protein|uniref:hypothetical protein n=1 Tax=unclassified Streptomyces TaxID=2593676 RepID=UPI000D37427E|nr:MULTISPECIES: hypothetical protein [unclassified Streptomyces]PTN00196.1 hypothetical protein C7821_101472 [Streptomyces sp. VMFN-G11Ma]
MTEAPLRAELLLTHDVSAELERELTAGFRELGAPAVRVRRTLDHRGPAELQWLALVSLPLQAFLSGLGGEAVKDGYRALRDLVARLFRRGTTAPDAAPRPLVLQDERTGLRIVLEADLPQHAYEQLTALDLSGFTVGPLHYDLARGRWRSELDEAAG